METARSGFPRARLGGHALEAARALLGATLVRDPPPTEPDEPADTDEPPAEAGEAPATRRSGRIVEVEAYLGPEDRASHARAGLTARTAPMFGPPGVAYVYLVYGMYDCLNVVTGPDGSAGAVLIRAVEPIEGPAAMRAALAAHRAARRRGPPATASPRQTTPDDRLAAGPGLVTAAFSVDRRLTGLDLCDPASALRLEAPPAASRPVMTVATPRIGVAYAGEPWASLAYRLVDASSPSVRVHRG